jgi:hypothetical protein
MVHVKIDDWTWKEAQKRSGVTNPTKMLRNIITAELIRGGLIPTTQQKTEQISTYEQTQENKFSELLNTHTDFEITIEDLEWLKSPEGVATIERIIESLRNAM